MRLLLLFLSLLCCLLVFLSSAYHLHPHLWLFCLLGLERSPCVPTRHPLSHHTPAAACLPLFAPDISTSRERRPVLVYHSYAFPILTPSHQSHRQTHKQTSKANLQTANTMTSSSTTSTKTTIGMSPPARLLALTSLGLLLLGIGPQQAQGHVMIAASPSNGIGRGDR